MKFDELSEKLADFDRYYKSDLLILLDELEVKRKEAQAIFLKALAFVGVILVFIGVFFQNMEMVFFAGVPSLIILGYFYRKITVIKTQAKQTIMPALCDQFGMIYQIKPDGGIIEEYKDLSLIPSFNEKKLEDEITGKIENVDFNLFEAKLVSISTDRKGRKTRTTVFKGLLTRFDFHKNFLGTTVIKKDWTTVGNFLTGWSNKGERVKLEDPIFEDMFEVYSTDQVEARYLLTPTFMQRILDFSKYPGVKKLQLAFHEGALLMAIQRSDNYFEGGGHNLNDPSYIADTVKDLRIIFDIVRNLNLDLRTKI